MSARPIGDHFSYYIIIIVVYLWSFVPAQSIFLLPHSMASCVIMKTADFMLRDEKWACDEDFAGSGFVNSWPLLAGKHPSAYI